MMLVILFYVTEKVVASGFSKCFFNILPENSTTVLGIMLMTMMQISVVYNLDQ